MLDTDIKVIRIMEDARWTDQAVNDPVIRIEFKVGTHGPFTERIPKKDYSAELRDAKLNAYAAEVRTTP